MESVGKGGGMKGCRQTAERGKRHWEHLALSVLSVWVCVQSDRLFFVFWLTFTLEHLTG